MSFFNTQSGAVKFYGPAVLPLSSSSFGTHLSQYGIGGFSELPDIQSRNQIPISEEMNADGVSSGRRKLGMIVYTIAEGEFFQLIPLSSDGTNNVEVSFTDWNNASDAQKMVWLNPETIREDIYGPTPTFNLISGSNNPNDCWKQLFFSSGISPFGNFLPLSGGTITGDLTVDGSFMVNGSATFVNSTNLSIEDPLIFIAQNNPANLVDMGIVGQFVNSPTQFTGLVRDHQTNEWFLFSGLTGVELTATDLDFTHESLKIDTLRANLIGDLLSSTRVFGNLSASGDVYGNNLHWKEWDSTWTTVSANSAGWGQTSIDLRALSANWQSTYTTVSANSATWSQNVTDLRALSASWQSTYTTVSANSATWSQNVTDLRALSANWQSTYTTVSANSASWGQTSTDLRALSGNWQSTYTTVSANSATWSQNVTDLRSLSGNWQSTYTTVSANSAGWGQTSTDLKSLSANWQSTYTNVSANSATWNQNVTDLRALSGNWQSTYTTVSTNSAGWGQASTDLKALSGNWQSTYTTVSANSATWSQNVTDLRSLSGNWESTYTTVSANSARWETAYSTLSGNILQKGNTFGESVVIGSNDPYSLVFETSGTSRIIILSGGNVGIGNTDPNYSLTVSGDISANAIRVTSGTTASNGILFGADTNLYRPGANRLKTDDAFECVAAANTTSNVVLVQGSSNAINARTVTSLFWTAGTSLSALSGNWQSTYTTVSANSATWGQSTTDIQNLSGNWQSTFLTVSALSSDWSNQPSEVVIARVFNADTVPLSRGHVVYTFGAQGDTMSVKLASNTSEATSSKTLGIVRDAIPVGLYGYVTLLGSMDKLHLNTSPFEAGVTFAEGEALWLGTIPGSYTNVKAVAPNHLVYLGVVERANNGNGIAYVKVQNGYELDEIHDVLVTSLSAGQVLKRNSLNNLWTNVDINTQVWNTTAAFITGNQSFALSANYVSKAADSRSITNSQIYDNGTNVGIGTITPAEKLTVVGSISASDYVFQRTKLKFVTENYTFSAEDQNLMVLFNSSNPVSANIPNDSQATFRTGSTVNFTTLSAIVYVTGEPGVTIRSADGRNYLRTTNSAATILKLNSNDWLLFGDIWSETLN